MNDGDKTISFETAGHRMELSKNGMTIDAKQDPENTINLTVEETKELLEALLVWQYGLEAIQQNDLEA